MSIFKKNIISLLKTNSYKLKAARGFTLVELSVSIAIMVIVISIVLFNYQQFNNTTVLSNVAYDVSLVIRKAQTYGISVRGASSSDFSRPYGIHISMQYPNEIIIFADLNSQPNGIYDSGDTVVESYILRKPYQVKYPNGLCTRDLSGTDICGLTRIDITFKRPNPDARIIASMSTETTNPAVINLGTTKDAQAGSKIVVSALGQISVQ